MDMILRTNFRPKRPDDGGKNGYKIPLIINSLDMKIKPMKIFIFDIVLTKAITYKEMDITKKLNNKDIILKVVREFLKDKDGTHLFDGERTIFSNELLPYPDGPSSIIFNYEYDGENTNCYFTINYIKQEDIDLNNLNNYLESGYVSSCEMPQKELRVLDTMMREMLLSKDFFTYNGKGVFNPNSSVTLDSGPYVLFEGYEMNVRPQMRKIRLNFDKADIIFREPINLLDYIQKIAPLDQFDSNMLIDKLKHLQVETRHKLTREGNICTNTYKIVGFSKKSSKEKRIFKGGSSFEEYFQDEYNITLSYPDLQMIKSDKKSFIPIELLYVLPSQDVIINADSFIPKDNRFLDISFSDRLDIFKKDIQKLEITNGCDKFLKNYMIDIDPNFINICGRVLDSPNVIFGDQQTEAFSSERLDFSNRRLVKPYDKVINWALFCIGQEQNFKKNGQRIHDIKTRLPEAAERVGIKMNPVSQISYVQFYNIEKDVSRVIEQFKLQEKKTFDLLVFVIYDQGYKEVKIFGDVNYGIATKCLRFCTTLDSRNLDEFFDKAILKINVRLGGVNWELEAIKNNMFTSIKQPYMVFGIDLMPPLPSTKNVSLSTTAMVGSMNHSLTVYNTTIHKQISKENETIVQVILHMENMVYQLLKSYCEKNSYVKPNHLIFYRKDVLEDQFEVILKHEIAAIKSACEKLENNYQPPITYIVAQQCHKIRFFPSSEDEIEMSGNLPPGIVVDTDITHSREFDFYLCTQPKIQGSLKPTHYSVLFDENNWESDDLQNFTYNLCKSHAGGYSTFPAPLSYANSAVRRGITVIKTSFIQPRFSGESEIVINKFHDGKLFFV